MIKVFVFLFCISSFVHARVFSMNDNNFGGFFNLTYGNSAVGSDYFKGESSATTFSKGFSTHSGGEFGFIYQTSKIAWLFGLEIIKPPKTRGSASTGATANYSYVADVSAYAPKFGVELIFFQNKDFKVFASGAVGSASVATKTAYSTVTIAPNADFTIEGKGLAPLMNYSVGGEMHWSDNTTALLSLGYRQLNFRKIKYLENVPSSFTGAHTKGEQIRKSDGTPLKYDFTNYYISLGLRFWIQ